MLWDWKRSVLEPSKEEPVQAEYVVSWREDFSDTGGQGKDGIPGNWQIKGKPGTPLSGFEVRKDSEDGSGILRVTSDKSSGSIVTLAKNVDLSETPMLRWKWRAIELPQGADGRSKEKDDQAIGIYVGDGSLLNSKSVSYRWDTDTPVGSEGDAVYGMGAVKVKWITLRNRDDVENGKWIVESRNFLQDVTKAWGKVPKKLYISVTTNSQYTGTSAEAELDWIEFTSIETKK